MMLYLHLWIFSFSLFYVQIYGQFYDIKPLDLFLLKPFQQFRANIYAVLGHNSEDLQNLERARSHNKLQLQKPIDYQFPCNVTGFRSASPPTTVHKVRPGDIDVIAAIGDSLTSANGLVATDLVQVLIQNRGLSWCIGGQKTWREYLTLPNILKEFNPNLIGYSLTDSLSTEYESQFNVAKLGAVSSEIFFMAKELIRRMKTDRRVNIKKHWKLITIMIGSNDFCSDLCYTDAFTILKNHRIDLLKTLRILRDNLPRTIINVVAPPDVKAFMKGTEEQVPEQCTFMRDVLCFCLFSPRYQHQWNDYRKVMRKWQELQEMIVSMAEFQKNDFAVIFQPFMINLSLPLNYDNQPDLSNLSQDCFHLSQKFNARIAHSLWSNMLEPVGSKTTGTVPLFERFVCPSERNPYIFTHINSNSL